MSEYNYKDSVDVSNLYIFYKEYNNERIIIYANSYLEAREAVLYYGPPGTYNLNEYLLQNVVTEKLFEVMQIDKDTYEGYPCIVNEYEYNQLGMYILNKTESKMHHTHVITKDLLKSLGGTDNGVTTEEYVNGLKEYTLEKKKIQNHIKQMLSYVGDIWYAEVFEPKNDGFDSIRKNSNQQFPTYVFGKSRLQCKDCVGKKSIISKIKLLINDSENITNEEIDIYMKMLNHIRKNDIKSFPFIMRQYNMIKK